MFYERSVKFILLTFFGLGLITTGACSNERVGADSRAQAALLAEKSTTVVNSRLVAVTATLKDSHAGLLAGRRFVLQSDDGKHIRSLTDARGALSLRLSPNANYILQPAARGTSGDGSDVFLKLRVDSTGQVTVTESRRLFASDLQSESFGPTEQDPNAAKFQSARFGESVFAP